MFPIDQLPDRPPATVVVRVPDVATTAADGLPAVLAAGRVRVVLPVWAAPNTTATAAWLRLGRTSCTPVDLLPGAVVRVRCEADVSTSSRVVVSVVTDRGVVATWRHQVG